MNEKIKIQSSLCPQLEYEVEVSKKEKIWMNVETIKTNGKIDKFIETLNNIKKLYPNIELTFDCDGEYSSEITAIKISVNKNGDYIGLITCLE